MLEILWGNQQAKLFVKCKDLLCNLGTLFHLVGWDVLHSRFVKNFFGKYFYSILCDFFVSVLFYCFRESNKHVSGNRMFVVSTMNYDKYFVYFFRFFVFFVFRIYKVMNPKASSNTTPADTEKWFKYFHVFVWVSLNTIYTFIFFLKLQKRGLENKKKWKTKI